MSTRSVDRLADELYTQNAAILVPEVRVGIIALRDFFRQLATDVFFEPEVIARQLTRLFRLCGDIRSKYIRQANIAVVLAESRRAREHMCPKSKAVAEIDELRMSR